MALLSTYQGVTHTGTSTSDSAGRASAFGSVGCGFDPQQSDT